MKLPQPSSDDAIHLGAVHEVRTDFVDAPAEVSRFLDEVNQCAHRLQSMKALWVDPHTDPIMPKVVWKIKGLSQAVLFRAVELQNAISILINQENFLGAIILTRTLIELMASVGDLYDRISRAVARENLGEIDSAVMAASFATRWEGVPEEAKATNILTLLEKFDRRYMKEKKSRPVTDVHAILSEYVHPNWAGMAGFFGTINYENRVEYMSVQHKDKPKLFVHIASGYMALLLIENIIKEISDLEANVWRISEDARLASMPKPEGLSDFP